ncbi:hypothetical protein GEMRC1_008507 [Eukaryota sp. GEM-RC1]
MSIPLTISYKGKKTVVKLTPAEPIGNAIKYAFDKWNLPVSEDIQLKHLRRYLDPSVQTRFSGVPSHTRLEVVESLPPVASTSQPSVSVAIAPIGEDPRVFGSFIASTRLFDILEQLQVPLIMDKGPITIQHGTKSVSIDGLRRSTLSSLGIEAGSVLLHVFWGDRPTEEVEEVKEKKSPIPTSNQIEQPTEKPPEFAPIPSSTHIPPPSTTSPPQRPAPQPKFVGEEVENDPIKYTRIFSPESKVAGTPSPPDSYFRVTPSDIQSIASSRQKGSRKDDDSCKSTVIKVVLPAKWSCETIFPSFVPVSDVFQWLQSIFTTEVSSHSFELLYGVPPKPITSSNRSLHDEGLSPSSLLRLRFLDGFNVSDCPFKDDLADRIIRGEIVPKSHLIETDVHDKPVQSMKKLPKWFKK